MKCLAWKASREGIARGDDTTNDESKGKNL